MRRRWLITGCDSGFGRMLAEEVVDRGDCAVVTVLEDGAADDLVAAYPDQVLPVLMDLRSAEQINAAVKTMIGWCGGIDVLVNNAGYALIGSVEETPMADVRALFEVDFFGALAMIQAVLPVMRQSGGGHVINISSTAGVRPVPGMAFYGGAKAALSHLSETVAQEGAPFGIRATAIEPGAHRTRAIGLLRLPTAASPVYAATVGMTLSYFENLAGKEPGDPRLAAKAILTIVDNPAPPARLPLGVDGFEAAQGRLAARHEELLACESLSRSTWAGT